MTFVSYPNAIYIHVLERLVIVSENEVGATEEYVQEHFIREYCAAVGK